MPYLTPILTLVFLILPGVFLVAIAVRRYLQPVTRLDPACKKCRYNLTGLLPDSTMCPECGAALSPQDRKFSFTWRTTPFTFHPAIPLALGFFLFQCGANKLLPHDYKAHWHEVTTYIDISGPDLDCNVTMTTSWRDTGRSWEVMEIPWLYRFRQMDKPPKVAGPMEGKTRYTVWVPQPGSTLLVQAPVQLIPLFQSGPAIEPISVDKTKVIESIRNQLRADSPQPIIDQITSDVFALYAGTPLDKLQPALGPSYTVVRQNQNRQHNTLSHTMIWPVVTLLCIHFTLWIVFFILCRRKYKRAVASLQTAGQV